MKYINESQKAACAALKAALEQCEQEGVKLVHYDGELLAVTEQGIEEYAESKEASAWEDLTLACYKAMYRDENCVDEDGYMVVAEEDKITAAIL